MITVRPDNPLTPQVVNDFGSAVDTSVTDTFSDIMFWTVPFGPTSNVVFAVDVFVAGGDQANESGFATFRATALFKRSAGVTQVGTTSQYVSMISVSGSPAIMPAIQFVVSGSNVKLQARAASGETYKYRATGKTIVIPINVP